MWVENIGIYYPVFLHVHETFNNTPLAEHLSTHDRPYCGYEMRVWSNILNWDKRFSHSLLKSSASPKMRAFLSIKVIHFYTFSVTH